MNLSNPLEIQIQGDGYETVLGVFDTYLIVNQPTTLMKFQ